MERKQQFASNLVHWFQENKRDLPFRKTKDPYSIWISEIMAQQTQIDTLIPYYKQFIQKFPDVSTLAAAEESDVLKAWEGLGYYSRAKNLHKAAKQIMKEHHGRFPGDYEEILALPGVGPYTGGAIASIALGLQVSAVDGNVLRVITRFNNWKDDIAQGPTKKKVTQWVDAALPIHPGDFNEGLMELGALICTPKAPSCLLCPVREACSAFASGTTEQVPVKTKKIKQKRLPMEVALLYDAEGIYILKRPNSGLLSGLWSFPICEANAVPGDSITNYLEECFSILPPAQLLGKEKHVFSHIIWDMSIYGFHLTGVQVGEPQGQYQDNTVFVSWSDLEQKITLPIAFSKLLRFIRIKK